MLLKLLISSLFILLLTLILSTGCTTATYPIPILVLENPTSGERVRFFPESKLKVPKDYDEKTHIESWTQEMRAKGFIRLISPKDDAPRLEIERKEARKRADRLLRESELK